MNCNTRNGVKLLPKLLPEDKDWLQSSQIFGLVQNMENSPRFHLAETPEGLLQKVNLKYFPPYHKRGSDTGMCSVNLDLFCEHEN